MIRKQILYLMDGLIFQENAERHPRKKGLLTIEHIFSIFIFYYYLFMYVHLHENMAKKLIKLFLSA